MQVYMKGARMCMYQSTQKGYIYASVYMYVYNVREWFTYMYISMYMNGIHICIYINVHEWFTYMYISMYMNGLHICIYQCT